MWSPLIKSEPTVSDWYPSLTDSMRLSAMWPDSMTISLSSLEFLTMLLSARRRTLFEWGHFRIWRPFLQSLEYYARAFSKKRPPENNLYRAFFCARRMISKVAPHGGLWSHEPWTAKFKCLLWLSWSMKATVNTWIFRFMVHETKTHRVLPPLGIIHLLCMQILAIFDPPPSTQIIAQLMHF